MSKSVYTIFECIDPETGKWEAANLYKKYDDGTYGLAQLITGNSEYYAALSGEESFDSIISDEGTVIDNLVDPLERIEQVVFDAICFNIPSNASSVAKEFYEPFGIEVSSKEPENKQYPLCVVYTLRDLDLIEVLAKGASAKALRFYNKYFAQVRWLLNAVGRTQYLTNGSDVRVLIWGS